MGWGGMDWFGLDEGRDAWNWLAVKHDWLWLWGGDVVYPFWAVSLRQEWFSDYTASLEPVMWLRSDSLFRSRQELRMSHIQRVFWQPVYAGPWIYVCHYATLPVYVYIYVGGT
jgi:hypothetical protein